MLKTELGERLGLEHPIFSVGFGAGAVIDRLARIRSTPQPV